MVMGRAVRFFSGGPRSQLSASGPLGSGRLVEQTLAEPGATGDQVGRHSDMASEEGQNGPAGGVQSRADAAVVED
jgi:hypothetical protein